MPETGQRQPNPRDVCACKHDRSEHRPNCGDLDSYDCPCACPSFDLWIPWD